MSVYVDWLMNNGWKLGPNCHMVTDDLDTFADLHAMAAKIGLKRTWFQRDASLPHYDLTASRRAMAVAAGAIAVDNRAQWGQLILPIKRAWSKRIMDTIAGTEKNL